MLEFIAVISTIIGTSIGIAIFIGEVTADPRRRSLAAFLWRASRANWRARIARGVLSLYSKLFAPSSFTWRFIARSLALYAFLVLASYIFLYAFFHETYVSVTYVLTQSSPRHLAIWAICMLASGFVFIIANAQTLYFLQILKETPTHSKFFLVSYSDILVTSSITSIGVALVQVLYSYLLLTTASLSATVQFDFAAGLQDGVAPPVEGYPEPIDYAISISDDEQTYRMKKFSFPQMVRLVEANRGLSYEYEQSSGDIKYTGKRPYSNDDLEQPSREGVAYSDRGYIFDFKAEFENQLQVCERFLEPSNYQPIRSEFLLSDSQKIDLIDACVNYESYTLNIDYSYKGENLDFQNFLYSSIGDGVKSFTVSVSNLFYSYQMVDPTDVPPIEVNEFADRSILSDLDDALENYADMKVGGNAYRSFLAPEFTLPLGTMHFAMFATSILTSLALAIMLLTGPIQIGLHLIRTRWADLKVGIYPFRLAGVLIGVWLASLYAFLSIFV